MNAVKKLQLMLDGFEKSPEAAGHSMRLQLADVVIAALRAKGWSQRRLAEAAGMKPSFITRVIHAESNCTFEVAGRILHALGLTPRLDTADIAIETPVLHYVRTEGSHGQEEGKIIIEEESCDTSGWHQSAEARDRSSFHLELV